MRARTHTHTHTHARTHASTHARTHTHALTIIKKQKNNINNNKNLVAYVKDPAVYVSVLNVVVVVAAAAAAAVVVVVVVVVVSVIVVATAESRRRKLYSGCTEMTKLGQGYGLTPQETKAKVKVKKQQQHKIDEVKQINNNIFFFF